MFRNGTRDRKNITIARGKKIYASCNFAELDPSWIIGANWTKGV